MLQHIAKFKTDAKGSLAAIFALATIPALGILGASLDYSRMSQIRAQLQSAADAATLAAVVLPASERNARASSVIDAYMKPYGNVSINKVYSEPSPGKYQVNLSLYIPQTYTALIGQSKLNVAVKSTAYVPVVAQPNQVSNVCFMMMSMTGDGALRVNSNANVDMGNCEAHVHSNHSQAFILNANSTFKTPRVCVKGKERNNGGSLGGGKVDGNCTPADDTIAGTLPLVNYDVTLCQNRIIDKNGMNVPVDQIVTINGQSVALGCHESLNINGNVADVTFAPGIHVIRGNMNLMGKVTANNVTFYMANGNAGLQMNGQTEFYASAPQTGPTDGILFYQANAIVNKVLVFNAKGGQTLEGLIYLPSYDIHFRSTVKPGTKDKITWVTNTFIADSTSYWQVEPAKRTIKTQSDQTQQASNKPPVLVH